MHGLVWSCLLHLCFVSHLAEAAYPHYPAREIISLTSWRRSFSNGTTAEVDIPDVFSERDVVTYERELPDISQKALLKFTCGLRCTLYVDGVYVAENNNTNLPIFAEIPQKAKSLALEVDSRFLGRHSMHQLQYDWWQPGGIHQSIELHLLRGDAFIEHVKVHPREFPMVRVEVAASQQLDLAMQFDEEEAFGLVTPPVEVAVPNPRRWSPSKPELHTLTVFLLDGSQIQDAVQVRFGLRYVEAHTGRIHINGEPLQLLGFNRHHFGRDGVLVSDEEIDVDILHIKNLGGNFLRGAHYPQDPRVLDACDEAGVLVWEEALGWQNTVEELTNSSWLDMQKEQVRRMVTVSANHPSVIIFGFLNEGMSAHPYSVDAYRELAETVRARDSTRLIGWASSVTIRDLAWEFADVIGFNDYTGWYRSNVDATIEDLKYVAGVWSYYHDWVVENFPGKPLIASEFGAGAIAGTHGSALKKWTEECQSVLVQLHLLGALQADLAGVCIWSFADFPVDPTTDPAYRPHGRNDKGLLTTDRKPKLVYNAVAAMFRGHRGLLLEEADLPLFKDKFFGD